MNQMVLAALAALAAGACAGIFLATRHFLRKRLPVWVAVLHGLGGATGFTLVLLVVVRQPDFLLARQALYLLIATVALGSVNLLFHVRGVRHRTSLIVMHALTAVSAVSTLIYALLVGPPSAPEVPAAPAPSSAPPAVAAAAASAEPAPAAAPSASAAAASVEEHAGDFSSDSELRQTLGLAISFAPRDSDILGESQPAIGQIAAALKQHPEVTLLQVQGHADERGGDASNLALTERRAAAVVDALVRQGVARARLHSAGFGARCPADPACRAASAPDRCHAPEQWQVDRRVVLVPLRVGKASLAGELVCAAGVPLIPPVDRGFHRPGAAP
jgi:outer membrane protein OmpA-like peptidoglycan-associated protein